MNPMSPKLTVPRGALHRQTQLEPPRGRRQIGGVGWRGGMPVLIAGPLKVARIRRAELERIARSSSLPHRVAVQSSALLLTAHSVANEVIARECSTTSDTVRRWRRTFESGGVDAVGSIAPGRDRKPMIPQEVIDTVVDDAFAYRAR